MIEVVCQDIRSFISCKETAEREPDFLCYPGTVLIAGDRRSEQKTHGSYPCEAYKAYLWKHKHQRISERTIKCYKNEAI